MNRWKIPELSARYKLEPSLRDVFVEGRTDRSFFQWYLLKSGFTDVKVVLIDSVEIPSETLRDLGLTSGNKQRLIALASEFNRSLGGTAFQPTCIVDADEDRILSKTISIPQLLWTDYSCVEAYLFNEGHFSKFYHMVLRLDAVDSNLLISYGKILSELFLIRAALRECAIPAAWITFVDCCNRTETLITFDKDAFIKRLLNASNQLSAETILHRTIESLRKLLTSDVRHSMNGHDLLELLHWEKRGQARRMELRSSKAVGAALFGCFEYNTVMNLPLFKTLGVRLSV